MSLRFSSLLRMEFLEQYGFEEIDRKQRIGTPTGELRRRRYQILREDVVVCLCVLDVLKGIL